MGDPMQGMFDNKPIKQLPQINKRDFKVLDDKMVTNYIDRIPRSEFPKVAKTLLLGLSTAAIARLAYILGQYVQWSGDSKKGVKATDNKWSSQVGALAGKAVAKTLGVPEGITNFGKRLGKSIALGTQVAAWAMKQKSPKTPWESIKDRLSGVSNYIKKKRR